MLRKVLVALGGTIFVAIGVALLGGWLDPSEFDAEGGSRRGRSLKRLIGWLADSLGTTTTGALLVAIGLVIVVLALKPKKKAEAKK